MRVSHQRSLPSFRVLRLKLRISRMVNSQSLRVTRSFWTRPRPATAGSSMRHRLTTRSLLFQYANQELQTTELSDADRHDRLVDRSHASTRYQNEPWKIGTQRSAELVDGELRSEPARDARLHSRRSRLARRRQLLTQRPNRPLPRIQRNAMRSMNKLLR